MTIILHSTTDLGLIPARSGAKLILHDIVNKMRKDLN